jgi:hypothetical protein
MSTTSWTHRRAPERLLVPVFSLLAMTTGCGGEGTTDTGETTDPVIFGADERLDYGAMSASEQAQARSVALHVFSSGLSCSGSTCSLSTTPFTQRPESFGGRLCEHVRFRGQLAADSGNCTAWLVASDMVATAGHCIDASLCSISRYVFGFTASASGSGEVTSFPTSDVYSCASVVTQFYVDGLDGPTDSDYALVRLDRHVPGRLPFFVRYDGKIPDGQQVVAFGHPSVLPLKLTRNMWTQDNTFSKRFYANGDIFGGNSGGPVLNLSTGIAEGIAVTQPPPRFAASSDSQGACWEYRVCADSGCVDPDVVRRLTGTMRIREVPSIPLHPALTAVL